MKTEQYILKNGFFQGKLGDKADLVLIFGATARLKEAGLTEKIRAIYPNACIFGCSTAGEIIDTQVLDDSLVVTAVSFATTTVKGTLARISGTDASYGVGKELAACWPVNPSGMSLSSPRAST